MMHLLSTFALHSYRPLRLVISPETICLLPQSIQLNIQNLLQLVYPSCCLDSNALEGFSRFSGNIFEMAGKVVDFENLLHILW